MDRIDPILYGKTRNFIDGAVTYLSPYVSRGVISTKFVLENILNRGYHPNGIEKFVQELAWRDYWQQV
jgi:deoxyribodipyrimidine photo-lyase